MGGTALAVVVEDIRSRRYLSAAEGKTDSAVAIIRKNCRAGFDVYLLAV
jgi:hypothetical protein